MATKKIDKEEAKELAFMKKHKAPEKMISAEKAEHAAMPKMKCGGGVKKMAKGGSASSRGDGIAIRGKTKGKFV